MKKSIVVLWMLLLLCGCGGGTGAAEEEPETDNALPGSWTVPEGWVRAEPYSTAEKIFYVEEGHEEDEQPDNISIEAARTATARKNTWSSGTPSSASSPCRRLPPGPS